MSAASPKPLIWIGSSRDDVRDFPEEVRSLVGHALYMAQCGLKHEAAKPLRGFGGAGVLEIVEDFSGETYRAVYTVSLPDRLYALHAFQKKSKRGIATPKQDLEPIRSRLKWAERIHAEWRRALQGERS
jgi:phage-related protein